MPHPKSVLLALFIVLLAAASVPQELSTGELQRFIYQANYPTWCPAAERAAKEMRVKPTTDPAFLHGVMKANIAECANTSYGQRNTALWTTAVFGASAAALLAARHESHAQATRDATHAKTWADELAGFTHEPHAGVPGPGKNLPSMYRTDAGRISRDATALLESLKA